MSSDRWYGDALRLKETGDFCYSRGDWRGAYRNYGMAAEHLLKAIYLRNTQQKVMPPEMRTAKSHNLAFIATAAGLDQGIAKFGRYRRVHWLVVRDYDQGLRYPNEALPSKEAKDFKVALLNPSHGVWPWLLNLYQSS